MNYQSIENLMFSNITIHKAGYSIILISILVFITFLSLTLYNNMIIFKALSYISFIFLAFSIYFFRSPKTINFDYEDIIVSPAYGTIDLITKEKPPAELNLEDDRERYRISIFLSVFNVHVNYMAITGVIKKILYKRGNFINAESSSASEGNESNYIIITSKSGHEVIQRQRSGLIARRIVCYVKEGQNLTTGSEYGIIRFGSRVDVYLPPDFDLITQKNILMGKSTIGGTTVLGYNKKK